MNESRFAAAELSEESARFRAETDALRAQIGAGFDKATCTIVVVMVLLWVSGMAVSYIAFPFGN